MDALTALDASMRAPMSKLARTPTVIIAVSLIAFNVAVKLPLKAPAVVESCELNVS